MVFCSNDPARKPLIRFFLILLVALMPPIWAPPGIIFGFPIWVVSALIVSLSTAGFILYVLFCVWKDPEDFQKTDSLSTKPPHMEDDTNV